MKTIHNLSTGDYIAFKWRYLSCDDLDIEVAQIFEEEFNKNETKS